MVVLNQELIVIRRQHAHLVMHALEDTTLHLAVPFRELSLRNAVLSIVVFVGNHLPALLIFFAPNVDIFRSYNHFYRVILSEARIDTIKFLSAEFHPLVADHRAGQDITLADKVRHKAVLWLIIDICRSSDLLNLSLTHHHHAVAQR